MHYRRTLPLLLIPALAVLLSMVRAADFGAWVVPNESIEVGSPGVLFNLTVNNTNQSVNITGVNITLPEGFVFASGSNQTSSGQAIFINDSANLTWTNQSQEGFIANMSWEWFVFNASVNTTPGDYYLNITVLDTMNVTNSTAVLIQVNDTVPPSAMLPLFPTPENNSWTNQSWFLVNMSFDELNPEACLLDLDNGSAQNWSMARTGNICWFNASGQSQGGLNWSVWVNDTSGNLAWNGTWSLNIGPVPHDLEPGEGTPPNGSVTGHGWFFTNFTFTEQDPDTCLLRLDNGSLWEMNMTVNATGGFCYLNVTGQGEGHLNYTFWMNNTQGAWNESGRYWLTLDLTPTVISNITAEPGIYSAPVSWETGFPADSAVYYGSGDEANLTLNMTNSTLDTNHSLLLDNLSMKTEYFYNITSCDNLSVCNTSGTWNFITLCLESWVYGEWGSCSGGYQYRSYTDSNGCGTYDNLSATSRECDDGGGGGGAESYPTAMKVWSGISPGTPAVMDIEREGISATSVSLEVSEKVGTCNVVVKGFSSRPSGVSETPPGRVHSYLNITTTANRSRVSRVTIGFSVGRSWIEGNSIDNRTIRLMRLEGNWTGLPTTLTGSDNTSLRFTAVSPGFSWLAVTGREIGEENLTGAGEPEAPSGVPEQLPEAEPGEEAPPEREGGMCEPGEHQCAAGLILQACNSWGTGWINEATCLYGCRDGECVTQLVIEVDYNQLWVAVAGIMILVAVLIIYIKRRAIDDFLFWRF
jgi:PGF-pre-PGF domain-containing protein